MQAAARLATSYPALPDVAGFPERWHRTFTLEVLDHDPHAPAAPAGVYDRARDAVTVSLQAQNVWEAHETLAALDVLANYPGLVLDFGAHVGWYTILAGQLGHSVIAWENDPPTVELLLRNAMTHGVDLTLMRDVRHLATPLADTGDPVSLVKIDLEGVDCWAVDICSRLFQNGTVAGALIEVSPIFEQAGAPCRYVDMVGRLIDWGYWPHQMPPKGWEKLAEYREAPLATLMEHRALGDDWAAVVAECRQDNFMFLPY